MARPRFRALAVVLLTAGLLLLNVGCAPFASDLVAFGAGYLLGRASGNPLEVVTVERVCYQAGERVPCP